MGIIALCCQQVLGANQERWRVPQLCALSNLQGANRDRWQELELERSQRVSAANQEQSYRKQVSHMSGQEWQAFRLWRAFKAGDSGRDKFSAPARA